MRAPYLFILASALILFRGTAEAATGSNTLSVSVTVADTCSFSAAPMVFTPRLSGIGAPTGSSTLKVACSARGPFNMILDGQTTRFADGRPLESTGSYTLQHSGTTATAIKVSIEY